MGWSIAQRFGLTHHMPQLSSKGYTIITPLPGDATYLLDMEGRFVHRWQFPDLRTHFGQLLPNGNLLMLGLERSLLPPPPDEFTLPPPPFERHIRRLGGTGSVLREVNWDGETVWEHKEPAVHHDFVRLLNGHTVFPVWVELPTALAQQVRGGTRRPREKLPPLLGDDIVEIDGTGNEVWRAETWKLFDPKRDPICPLEKRWEWTHTNSIDVSETGDILISCRINSRVAIIARESGQIVWKYGFPDTAHQHHASWVGDGHVQMFDNGMHRLVDMSTSRVIEVDPASNEIVWSYQGNPTAQLFSGHISGAARLPGGNILICEGTSGRLLEITLTGVPVWEWWNPIYNPRPDGTRAGWLFRADRYVPDYPGLHNRELDPRRLSELNRLYGLM